MSQNNDEAPKLTEEEHKLQRSYRIARAWVEVPLLAAAYAGAFMVSPWLGLGLYAVDGLTSAWRVTTGRDAIALWYGQDGERSKNKDIPFFALFHAQPLRLIGGIFVAHIDFAASSPYWREWFQKLRNENAAYTHAAFKKRGIIDGFKKNILLMPLSFSWLIAKHTPFAIKTAAIAIPKIISAPFAGLREIISADLKNKPAPDTIQPPPVLPPVKLPSIEPAPMKAPTLATQATAPTLHSAQPQRTTQQASHEPR